MAAPAAVEALRAQGSGLGLANGAVHLVNHDPRWSSYFAELASEILVAIDHSRAQVEHVGSTSVPGLSAKPLLDIAVGIPQPIDNEAAITALEPIGFEFQQDLGIYGGLFFTVSASPTSRVAHLHVVDIDDFQWRWYLAFRDGLRSDPRLASEYETVKQAAAQANPGDRDAYTKAKFDWVLATVNRLDRSVTQTD